MKVLKDEAVQTGGETTAKVDGASPKTTNPKYVVEAVAVQLGLRPSDCRYLWPHYISMVRHSPLVPCIRCGAASESDLVVDVEGPTFLINRTRSVNRAVSEAFKAARDYIGSAVHTKESDLFIFNGFCESCLGTMEESLPQVMRLGVPEDDGIKTLRELAAKAMRLGFVDEAIRALRKIVDQPVGPTIS